MVTSSVGRTMPFRKWAAAHRAVLHTEHGMHMQARLAVIAARDVAQQTQRLALLADLDRPVGLVLEVEQADRRAFERAERGERCSGQRRLLRESR